MDSLSLQPIEFSERSGDGNRAEPWSGALRTLTCSFLMAVCSLRADRCWTQCAAASSSYAKQDHPMVIQTRTLRRVDRLPPGAAVLFDERETSA
jgi:hypothetical protein